MSQKQLTRFEVLSKAIAEYITVKEASEALGISERQVKRLKKKVRDEGATGLVHKNSCRVPVNKIPDSVKTEILMLRKQPTYERSNFKHYQEILSERHGIDLSYPALCRILKEEGIQSPKKRRRFKPHRRRKRRPQAGLLLQVDATPFAWFDGDRSQYALHGAIDDATGQITALFMCKNECLHGYFQMLKRMIDAFGVPVSIYADRHTIFQSPNAAKHELDVNIPVNDTQLGRSLKELSVTLIAARSPQAKGRVERLWGTLQSRLPVEFAIRGIRTIEEANKFLLTYVYAYNSSFATEPEKAQSAFRKINPQEDLEHILCIKERRVVDAGGVFSVGGKTFKIVDAESAPIPVKAKVDVLLSPSFGVKASFKGTIYDTLPFVPPKRRKPKPVSEPKRFIPPSPPPDHAWRVNLRTHFHGYDEYENEDAYHETVRMLEKMFLGKNR